VDFKEKQLALETEEASSASNLSLVRKIVSSKAINRPAAGSAISHIWSFATISCSLSLKGVIEKRH
jgi:hypothetical protein